MLKGRKPKASNVGGCTIGISFVVQMLMVAKFVPALEPMYGIPWFLDLEKVWFSENL